MALQISTPFGRRESGTMKQRRLMIIIVTLTILLSGCSEIRYAKANRIRQQTKRADDIHDQSMEDSEATKQARIDFKNSLLYAGAAGGSIFVLVTAGAWSYYVVAVARTEVRKRQIIQLADPQGRRFPVLITDTNLINISTGQRFSLNSISEPSQLLVSSSTAVQLNEPVKLINGKVT